MAPIPTVMRAAFLTRARPIAERPLEIGTIATPLLQPGHVLLKVRACGVCRTDLHIVEGELPALKASVTPGHQIVGDVKHPLAIELARDAAGAQLELARLRHFKADLIDRVAAFGSLEAPEIARLSGEEIWIMEELYPNRFLGKKP